MERVREIVCFHSLETMLVQSFKSAINCFKTLETLFKPLKMLCDDVWYKIFLMLDPRSFLRLRTTSRHLHLLSSERKLLKDYVVEMIGFEDDYCSNYFDESDLHDTILCVAARHRNLNFLIEFGHYKLLEKLSLKKRKRLNDNCLSTIIKNDYLNTFLWYKSINPVSVRTFIRSDNGGHHPKILNYFFKENAKEISNLVTNNHHFDNTLLLYGCIQLLISKEKTFGTNELYIFFDGLSDFYRINDFHRNCLHQLMTKSDLYKHLNFERIVKIFKVLKIHQCVDILRMWYETKPFDYNFDKIVNLLFQLDELPTIISHLLKSFVHDDIHFLISKFFESKFEHKFRLLTQTNLLAFLMDNFPTSIHAALLDISDFVNCLTGIIYFVNDSIFNIWLKYYNDRFTEINLDHFHKICVSLLYNSSKLQRFKSMHIINIFEICSFERFECHDWINDFFQDNFHNSVHYHTFSLTYWKNVFSSRPSPKLLSFFMALPYCLEDKVKVYCYFFTVVIKKEHSLNFCFTKLTMTKMIQHFVKLNCGLENLIQFQPTLSWQIYQDVFQNTHEKLVFLQTFLFRKEIMRNFDDMKPFDVDYLFMLFFNQIKSDE